MTSGKLEPDRFKYVRIVLSRAHRYRWYRGVSMSVSLLVLLVVVGGAHRALGRSVDLTHGLVAVGVAIAGFYVVTFLVNIPAGRMFCGFGCPVGQLSRFADTIDAFPKDAGRRRRGWLELLAFATVLALTCVLWWTSPGAFVSWPAAATAWSALALLAGYTVVHARVWRWGFCRKLCPIGLYYSVVQTSPLVGIDFDPARTCTDCGGCAAICPVHLDPRRLEDPIASPGGLAFSGFPAANHCLHCGACVEACEHLTRKAGGPPAMGFRRPHDRPRA